MPGSGWTGYRRSEHSCRLWFRRRSPDRSPPARASGSLRNRALGTVRVLRGARPAHPVPDRHCDRRPGLEPGACQPAVWLVQRFAVFDPGSGWVAGRPPSRSQPLARHWRRHHLPGLFHPGPGHRAGILRRAGPRHHWDRVLQAQCVHHGGPALLAPGPPPRFRLHPLLYGNQSRRPAGSSGVRLVCSQSAVRLVLGLWDGWRRHAHRPGFLSGDQEQSASPGRNATARLYRHVCERSSARGFTDCARAAANTGAGTDNDFRGLFLAGLRAGGLVPQSLRGAADGPNPERLGSGMAATGENTGGLVSGREPSGRGRRARRPRWRWDWSLSGSGT
jgi:hypothetical protein